MAKVIEHGTETRDRLETAIEDEAMRRNMPPEWSKQSPTGAYGRPAERLLTKPIDLTFEAKFAGALHQLNPQETVSYDARGGEVDPATVRALNTAEDRAAEQAQKHEKTYTYASDITGVEYRGLNAREAVELWCADTHYHVVEGDGPQTFLTVCAEDGDYIAGGQTWEDVIADELKDARPEWKPTWSEETTQTIHDEALRDNYALAESEYLKEVFDKAAGVNKGGIPVEIAAARLGVFRDALTREGIEVAPSPASEALQIMQARHDSQTATLDREKEILAERQAQEVGAIGYAFGFKPESATQYDERGLDYATLKTAIAQENYIKAPATVRALNAAEDRDLGLNPAQFQREYATALLAAYERIPNSEEIARTQPSLPDDRVQELEAYGLEKGYLARNPAFPHNCYDALSAAHEEEMGWGFPDDPACDDVTPEPPSQRSELWAEAERKDPLADFIERRKLVEKPEFDPRQHEMKLKRGPKL